MDLFRRSRRIAFLFHGNNQDQSGAFGRYRFHLHQSGCSCRQYIGRNRKHHERSGRRTKGNTTDRKLQQSSRIRNGFGQRCLARYVHRQTETLGRTAGQKQQCRCHLAGNLPPYRPHQELQPLRILSTDDFRLRNR